MQNSIEFKRVGVKIGGYLDGRVVYDFQGVYMLTCPRGRWQKIRAEFVRFDEQGAHDVR